MKGCMTTDLGIITVDPEVIAKYAGTVAVECFGIVGMAALNVKDGLVKLLKRDYLTHGINVVVDENNKIIKSSYIWTEGNPVFCVHNRNAHALSGNACSELPCF